MTNAAIIVAAGRSVRMDGADKMLAPINGRPLLTWTLEAFRACRNIESIVVVASLSNTDAITDLVRSTVKVREVVLGGERRRDSVKAGLDALAGVDYVVVH